MSGAVESQLRSMGLSVERVAGQNRFETAAMVAQRVKNKSNSNKVILINGEKDADALTVSSLAIQAGVPVLMTRANSLRLHLLKNFLQLLLLLLASIHLF